MMSDLEEVGFTNDAMKSFIKESICDFIKVGEKYCPKDIILDLDNISISKTDDGFIGTVPLNKMFGEGYYEFPIKIGINKDACIKNNKKRKIEA